MVCPRLTSELTGAMNAERKPWNARSMPAVNCPFMMSKVPAMSTVTFASCTSRPGTAPK